MVKEVTHSDLRSLFQRRLTCQVEQDLEELSVLL